MPSFFNKNAAIVRRQEWCAALILKASSKRSLAPCVRGQWMSAMRDDSDDRDVSNGHVEVRHERLVTGKGLGST